MSRGRSMRPLVMGILNVTPDSFFDGGRYFDPGRAIEHGRAMAAEGAAIVDVGGESTRPGATPVPAEEELRRVLPVIEGLAGQVRLSIDTTKAVVATAALRAGATLVNDVSSKLLHTAAEHGAGYVAMHHKGTPETMQIAPEYADVVGEVHRFLVLALLEARAAGLEEVYLDPGIGFAKTIDHNLALLRALPRLVEIGAPILLGVSRKRFLGSISLPRSVRPRTPDCGGAVEAEEQPGGRDRLLGVEDRLEASLAAAVFAGVAGVSMIRVHDVACTVQAMALVGDIGAGAQGD